MWRSQAEAEGLTLLEADTKTGYYGVRLANPGRPKPYQARVIRGGTKVSLGMFATAEAAALCVARSPEGQAAAAKKAAVAARRGARSIRRKTAPGARSAEKEAEAVVEVEVWEVVEAEEGEAEAEDVQIAVETVEVVEVMEPEGVADEGGRSTGRSEKRRRNM